MMDASLCGQPKYQTGWETVHGHCTEREQDWDGIGAPYTQGMVRLMPVTQTAC